MPTTLGTFPEDQPNPTSKDRYFKSRADLPDPKTFGPGQAQVGNQLYLCDGTSYIAVGSVANISNISKSIYRPLIKKNSENYQRREQHQDPIRRRFNHGGNVPGRSIKSSVSKHHCKNGASIEASRNQCGKTWNSRANFP